MNTEQLKYVVGELEENQPAFMRFYGALTEYSACNFNEEFAWIKDNVRPSKIVIGINCEGGSVIHGMGTFSLIQSSNVEVETVIEGLAASMGSVLWAAGTRAYMRDYSLLMIHNPFLKNVDGDLSPEQQQIVNAFKKQVETVYQKRFGLSAKKVQKIMDGAEGCDGTWMTADEAVKAGILPKSHVLETPSQIAATVHEKIQGVTEVNVLNQIMSDANKVASFFKPLSEPLSIHKQTSKQNTMNDKDLSSICAALGLAENSDMMTVCGKLTEIKKVQKEFDELKSAYNALKIQKEGSDTNLVNMKSELDKVKGQLKVYKDAEAAQAEAAINTLIDQAVAEGKIPAESKDKWVSMARTDMKTVSETLATIPARVVMTKEIANDPDNVHDAVNGATEAEILLNKEIDKVCGADFQFRTME